jgi:hypothetical protein
MTPEAFHAAAMARPPFRMRSLWPAWPRPTSLVAAKLTRKKRAEPGPD